MIGLTERQQEILEFIQTDVDRRGFAPTVREIQTHFRFKSTNAVHDHLRALQRKGYIHVEPECHRGILPKNLLSKKLLEPTPSVVDVPFYSRIEPGPTPFLPENEIRTQRIDTKTFGGRDLFGLRIQGDALAGMGIYEGDNVLFLRRPFMRSGELACIAVAEVVLVRYVHIGRATMVLMPANPRYGTITMLLPEFRKTSLLGVAVGMWRSVGE